MHLSGDGRHGVIWGDGSVYRTADGGDHWAIAPIPEGLFLYAMSFLDPDHGWAVLQSSYRGTLALHTTNEGGQTWQARGVLD